MGRQWTLQDAKNKFSAVVEAAQAGEPQRVTKRGVEAVVVISAAEFERLAKLDLKPKKTFHQHLMDFPEIPEEFEDIFEKREPMQIEPSPYELDLD